MTTDGRLSGQVAVITGAASGIGEGIASRFAAEGARVVVADIDTEKGSLVAKQIDGTFVACDVTREADLAQAIDTAISTYGALHTFVGNAGLGGARGEITDLDEAGFDDTVAVLLKGVAFGMKHACRAMRTDRGGQGGSIISTSSVAGLVGGLGPHVYSACKAGVVALTRSVAQEQGPHGIRVNCVNPGGVETPIFSKGLEGEAAAHLTQRVASHVATVTPLGRIGQPADIAAAALWLASPEAAYVTGQAIVVDGGLICGHPAFAELQSLGQR
jgi:NAD(P)-dependent dehydrogenase (short-subunit alcohol dehydrogenase family)